MFTTKDLPCICVACYHRGRTNANDDIHNLTESRNDARDDCSRARGKYKRAREELKEVTQERDYYKRRLAKYEDTALPMVPGELPPGVTATEVQFDDEDDAAMMPYRAKTSIEDTLAAMEASGEIQRSPSEHGSD